METDRRKGEERALHKLQTQIQTLYQVTPNGNGTRLFDLEETFERASVFLHKHKYIKVAAEENHRIVYKTFGLIL